MFFFSTSFLSLIPFYLFLFSLLIISFHPLCISISLLSLFSFFFIKFPCDASFLYSFYLYSCFLYIFFISILVFPSMFTVSNLYSNFYLCFVISLSHVFFRLLLLISILVFVIFLSIALYRISIAIHLYSAI